MKNKNMNSFGFSKKFQVLKINNNVWYKKIANLD